MKNLKIVFLIALISHCAHLKSSACTCAFDISISEALEGARQVFTGKVIDITYISDNNQSHYLVHFRIKKFHIESGKEYKKTLKIRTEPGAPQCGYKFIKGGIYLVYAYKDGSNQQLSTTQCSRNKRWGRKKEAKLIQRHLSLEKNS